MLVLRRLLLPRLLRPLLLLAFAAGVILLMLAQIATPPADAQTGTQPTPRPLFALPDARTEAAHSSGTMALGRDGITIAVANLFNDSITLVQPANDRVLAEIAVGSEPRNVAITPDGTRALVTNRASGTLSVVDLRAAAVTATIPLGLLPYGVVSGSDSLAYAALQGSAEVVEIDLTGGRVSRRIRVPGTPSGLALWGDFLYVTDFWTGEISLVYLPAGQMVARGGSGSASVSPTIALDITRGIAYVPQTQTNSQNPHLTYDSVVSPVVNVIRLSDLTINRSARLSIDRADQPVNMPFALALDRFAERVYVVNAGSDSLTVLDLDGRWRGSLRLGSNPRGVLLNRDSSLLYVHNAFDGTIFTIRTRDLTIIDRLPVARLDLPTDVLIGTRLFYSATDPRMSRDGWLSCANCHFDGMSDGRIWSGFPGGARNTPVLFGLADTAPYTRTGVWDELADIEIKIRALQSGTGLTDLPLANPAQGAPHSGLSADLDALVSYLNTLSAPPPQTTAPDRIDQVMRGAALFETLECAACHPAPSYTNQQVVDVGTLSGAMDELVNGFDTPSLRYLALSAPYYHDGRSATLQEVFAHPGTHQLVGRITQAEIDDLIAFLWTLSG
jgi:YVTN family beta-propeller protein